MVHDHRAILAEILVDALTLGEILGDALIGVIADALVEADRLLRHHAQAVFERADRHAVIGMDMHRAVDIIARGQNAAMQRETGPVDAGLLVQVAIHGNLHQIGRGHLGIEQVMFLHEK